MKRIIFGVVCVLAGLLVSGRTVSVGNLVGLDATLEFGATANETNVLVMAWGDADAGTNPAAWPHRRFLGLVYPAETSRTVSLPDAWGSAGVTRLRFFLQNGVEAPANYVTDGLVTRWDAIDNAGTGAHDASAKVWKDLAGSLDLTLTNNATWKDGVALSVKGCSAFAATPSPAYLTVEAVGRNTTVSSEGRIVFTSGIGGDPNTQLNRLVCDMPGTVQFMAGSTTVVPTPQDGSFVSRAATYSGNTPTAFYADGAVAHDGVQMSEGWRRAESGVAMLGGRTFGEWYTWSGELHTIRLYSRALTADELAENFKLDAVRFLGFPDTITATTASDALAFATRISVKGMTTDAQGAQTAVTLAFTGVTTISELYMVWASDDKGDAVDAWPNRARIAFVQPGESGKTVALPSSWGGASARAARFYLVAGITAPAAYVTSGLVTRWDGLDNAGTGTHDASAKVWKDLAGSLDLTLTNNASWRANGLLVNGCSAIGAASAPSYRTIEVVFTASPISSNSILFYSGLGGSHTRSVFVDTVGAIYFDGSKTTLSAPIDFTGTTRVFSATYDGNNTVDSIRADGDLHMGIHLNGWNFGLTRLVKIGSRNDNTNEYPGKGTLHALRLYNRVLTTDELLANAALDMTRFCGVSSSAGEVTAVSSACAWAEGTPQGEIAATVTPLAESMGAVVDLRTGVRTVRKQNEILPFTWSSTNFTGVGASSEYVTDGLVACWDGINNTGLGYHDPTATVWKDLAGSYNLTIRTDFGAWSPDGKALVVDGPAAIASGRAPNYRTIEIVYKHTQRKDRNVLFASANLEGSNGNLNSRWFLIDSDSSGSTSMKGYFDGTKTTKYFPMTFDADALRTAVAVYDDNSVVQHVYGDGVEYTSTMNNTWNNWSSQMMLGNRTTSRAASDAQYDGHAIIYTIRLYGRALSEEELARNRALDLLRFGGDSVLSVKLEDCTARVRVVQLDGTGDNLASWREVADSGKTLVQAKGESTVQWFAKPGVWKAVLEIVYNDKVLLEQSALFDLRAFTPSGTTIVFR